MKPICVLGSTGSVGRQTLDVARQLGIAVSALAARTNLALLARQAREFRPSLVAVGDLTLLEEARHLFHDIDPGITVLGGAEGIADAAANSDAGIVVNALVGAAGIMPTLAALEAGRDVALANKEALVAAGALVTVAAARSGAQIRPVDSEHSAIWQCIAGSRRETVQKILLTASGGPFRDCADLSGVTPEQALAHPNWRMGPKVSVDSATMINKALEVIEARWLFDIEPARIEVVVHRQSVVHSMVEFVDGCVIAQLGTADMRAPIQHALTWPERLPSPTGRLDFSHGKQLSFEAPDTDRFPGVLFGHLALERGPVAPAVMSAANEEAVKLFLEGRIAFTAIAELVRAAMDRSPDSAEEPTLEQILEADRWAREYVMGRCGVCTHSLS
ncbi:MAG: 1-deoxy-D-xylulose 5-phosphate reductoisomerase [Firmicutes bacterium ADurb.Bin506]|jgi:1-deoxy-D-xylulose-5-phosphate reductoisomerase|nr:MAG: 1-deoxy-D-xylulose 5-phosphate reductoisomerase [Firmicutes bacterium ADurb.Bin506]